MVLNPRPKSASIWIGSANAGLQHDTVVARPGTKRQVENGSQAFVMAGRQEYRQDDKRLGMIAPGIPGA